MCQLYTYEEAVQLLQDMPHFQPPVEAKKDFFSLDAERHLLQKLGNPEEKLQYIHVAGTNGKGSTCAYLASILKENQKKVGSFTSPFLYSYREMFVINGEQISEEAFATLFSKVWQQVLGCREEGFYPSEYEILTSMAFLYFLQEACDVVVLEVSLGGRLDTTNVIPAPEVTVITPISYDHMGILGNTLTEIATEKAGIIKCGTVVVSAPQEAEVVAVLQKTCEEKQVPLFFAPEAELVERSLDGQKFRVKCTEGQVASIQYAEFNTSLLGTYQIQNAALAITATCNLELSDRDRDEFLSGDAMISGIRNTTWFGRFTLLQRRPFVIIDGGHNRQGAQVLRDSLETYFPGKKITFLMGILKDKEVDRILDTLMPIAERVYVTEVPNARTMSENELVDLIRQRNVKAETFDTNRIHLAETDVLCICGSLYLLDKIKSISFN